MIYVVLHGQIVSHLPTLPLTVDRKIDELNKCCFCWDIVGINESYRHFANAEIPHQLPLGVLVAQTGNKSRGY